MTLRRRAIAAGACGLCIMILAGLQTSSLFAQSASPGGSQGAGGARAPVVVETAAAALQPMPQVLSAVGTLQSRDAVSLRPEVSGRISAIHFSDGMDVARGKVLVELDAAIQRAELQQARADLALAESSHRRTEDLFRRGFVSQSARDEAGSRRAVAAAALELAEARLARMRLVAPFEGTVGMRDISVGAFVKDGDVLVNIEDLSALTVDFRLPEAHLPRVAAGQRLEVVSDALPGTPMEARVTAIAPQVDAQGRSLLLRAEIDNAGRSLRPGMFVRVTLVLDARENAVTVPEEALVPELGGRTYVYRVIDDRARRTPVQPGSRRDGRVEVLQGIAAGDIIVTAGQVKLRDGDPVRVQVPAQASRY